MMGGQSGQLPGFGRIVIQRRRAALLLASGCNFLAKLSFMRPRVSSIFLTRLHETTSPGYLS